MSRQHENSNLVFEDQWKFQRKIVKKNSPAKEQENRYEFWKS
jgi:hypothetical protein